jgi:hypothetical protein
LGGKGGREEKKDVVGMGHMEDGTDTKPSMTQKSTKEFRRRWSFYFWLK